MCAFFAGVRINDPGFFVFEKSMHKSQVNKVRRKKNQRVKIRPKVRQKYLKKILLVSTGGVFLCLSFLSFVYIGKYAKKAIFKGSFSRIKSIRVEIDHERVKREVYNLIKDFKGEFWGAAIKRKMMKEITLQFPYFSSLKIYRNIFTGCVTIKGKLEVFAARNKTLNGYKYISLSGRVYSETYDNCRKCMEIEAPASGENLKILSGFSHEIYSLLPMFSLKPVKIIFRKDTAQIMLEDGSLVDWGRFEFNKLKIVKLNEVLADVSRRLNPPYKISLAYFNSGRIYAGTLKEENKGK